MLTRMLRGLSLDIRLAIRMLAKYPGLTVVSTAALAFGIAAGVMTFELRNQFVDPAIPLDEGSRLVGLRFWHASRNVGILPTAAEAIAWRDQLSLVEDVSAFTVFPRNLILDDGQSTVEMVAAMSPSAFRAVRVPPLVGRTLIDADGLPGAPPVIVLGHDIWAQRFSSDPGIIGRTVRVGRERTTVVGVMPEGFRFPAVHTLWVPLREHTVDAASDRELLVFGRLAAGASRDQAQAELAAISARLAAAAPARHEHLRPQIVPFAWLTFDPGDLRLGLSLANAFVIMLLVIVSGNVALLVFARAATRESEIAVRSALGAGRTRIVAQLVVEALALAGVAVAAGLVAAQFGLRSYLAMYQADSGRPLPFWVSGRLTLTTVFYAVGLAVLATSIVGVVPALKATGRGLQDRLRQSSAGGGGHRFGGVWTVAIAAQVAVTLMFPATAFFFHRWVVSGQTRDVGFDASKYLSARLQFEPPGATAASPDATLPAFRSQLAGTYTELVTRLQSDPAVVGLTAADRLPGTLHARWRVEIEGEALPAAFPSGFAVSSASVAPNFFDVLGAPILDGRPFTAADLKTPPEVAIVNQSFVNQVLNGRNPLGRRIRHGDGDGERQPGPWLEIVGVVRDLGMGEEEAGLYRPVAPDRTTDLRLIVGVRGDPLSFASRLRAIAIDVEPGLQLRDVMPLDRVGESQWLESQYLSRLLAVLSATALLLSLTAIYSVTAVIVSRRTREIGLRVALGANRHRVVAEILRRPLAQVVLGVTCGSVLVVAMFSGMYESTPTLSEALLIAAYAVAMVGVCLLACVVPARRALAIEPAKALAVEG